MKDRRLEVFTDRKTTYIRSIVAGTIGSFGGSSGALGNRRGITLIEILVVISIITIITALAIPEIGDYRTSADANRAATFILADMQLSRTGAIFTNKQYRLTFNPTAEVTGSYKGIYFYEIHRKPYTAAGSWELVKKNYLPGGIEYGLFGSVEGPSGATVPGDGVSFSSNAIYFENTGGASEGFVYVMPFKDKLDSRTDRMRAARIEFGPTGKVKAYRYNNAAWTNSAGWKDF